LINVRYPAFLPVVQLVSDNNSCVTFNRYTPIKLSCLSYRETCLRKDLCTLACKLTVSNDATRK